MNRSLRSYTIEWMGVPYTIELHDFGEGQYIGYFSSAKDQAGFCAKGFAIVEGDEESITVLPFKKGMLTRDGVSEIWGLIKSKWDKPDKIRDISFD
jgi:hypothetical protein